MQVEGELGHIRRDMMPMEHVLGTYVVRDDIVVDVVWVKTTLECPLCHTLLERLSNSEAVRPARVVYILGVSSSDVDYIMQRVPDTHLVHRCKSCRIGFTTLRDK